MEDRLKIAQDQIDENRQRFDNLNKESCEIQQHLESIINQEAPKFSFLIFKIFVMATLSLAAIIASVFWVIMRYAV